MRVAADAPNAADFRCGYVAIAGRPNVGKSTLLNRLVGRRVSITSRKAQTTRHRVTGIVTTPDAQVLFVDTPGFQTKHRSRLNDRMNRAVTQCLADVDALRDRDRSRPHHRRRPRGDPPSARKRPRHRRSQQDRSRQGARRDAAADGGARRALPVRGHRSGERGKGSCARRSAGGGSRAAAGGRRDLRRGRDHRSRRAFSRRRVRAGEDLPAAGRGSAVRDDGGDRSFRARGRAAPDPRHRSTWIAKTSGPSCWARAGRG